MTGEEKGDNLRKKCSFVNGVSKIDTIEGMRTFAAVAAHRSFTEGAKQVGISTKLASKYVGQLEARLGAQLFHRTTRSVTLTETGQAYYSRCLPLIEQFDELEGLVQRRQGALAGRIRIAASTGFGTMHLTQMLRPFQQSNPDVQVELLLSDHNVSLVEEGFDLAIRFGSLSDSSLVARKLTEMPVTCCASPGYLDAHGTPETPEALTGHNCLLLTLGAQPDTWRFKGPQGILGVNVSGSFRSNSLPAVVRMAVDGMGICRLPAYMVRPYLENGSLRALFEMQEIDPLALYVVYPPSRHLTARIRALIDHLSEQF
jgi:DNA-binding transcriptional LysR family regulator